ncbi:MAG: polysaccharide deacetylase family protein [Anaerovoracaceae bacterium]
MRTNKKFTVKRKKKKYKGVGRFVFICVIIVALAAGGFVVAKHLGRDTYDSEGSFEGYAKDYFSTVKADNATGDSVEEFKYGEPNSVATDMPKLSSKAVTKKLTDFVNSEKSAFESNYGGSAKDSKNGFFAGYQSYKSDKNTMGVAMYTTVKQENKDGNMDLVSEKVKAVNFNAENGGEILPIMAFENGYKEKITKILTDKVKEEYGDDLKSKYKSYIANDSDFTEKMVFTEKGAKVYFDAGSILDLSKGAIVVDLSNDDLDGILRDKINPRNIDPNKPMVAITFDDGPGPKTSDQIIDSLEKYNAVATYFELGQNVANVKDADKILKRKMAIGCEIASHSWSHPNLFTLSDAQIKVENDKTDAAIKKITGFVPTLYRPPYGNGNEKTDKIFNKSGILWSVDTLDWKSRNKDAIFKVIKSQKTLDGRVVLLHSIHQPSADSMELILPWLKEQGYQTVTVSELLAYKYGEDPSVPKFYGYNYFYGEDSKKDK